MPLDFNDAMDAGEFLEWMATHAPGLIPEVKSDLDKNLTVGDVHVPAAGGDGKKKKKKPEPPISVAYTPEKGFEDKTFDEAGSSDQAFDYWIGRVQKEPEIEKLKIKHKTSIDAQPAELKALMEALNTNPSIRAVLLQALAVGKATRTITVIRHGATNLNNQDTSVDRIRGWKDVPLSEEGKEEAAKLAEKLSKEPPDHLVCSDLKRAHDTAKMIAAACDMKIDDVSKGFRPWDVGEFAGKSSKDAVPILAKYAVETPDQKTPGGESFNTFRSRFFNALSDAVKKYPGNLAVVTHHRGERLLTSWEKAGYPADGSIDGKEFTKKGEATAGYEQVEIPVDRLHAAASANVTKFVGEPIDYDKVFESVEKTGWTDEAREAAAAARAHGWQQYMHEPSKNFTYFRHPGFPGHNITTRGPSWLHNREGARGLIAQGPSAASLHEHLSSIGKSGEPIDYDNVWEETYRVGKYFADYSGLPDELEKDKDAQGHGSDSRGGDHKWLTRLGRRTMRRAGRSAGHRMGLKPAGAALGYDIEGGLGKTELSEDAEKDFTLNVRKVDEEQRIFYGWAYVSEEDGKVIIDKQDDYILPEDLVKAAEDFTLHGGKLGDMHDARNVGRVVASFVTSADNCGAFGISMAKNRRGWILGFKVDDPEVWSKIKSGGQLELSIAGRGVRMEE